MDKPLDVDAIEAMIRQSLSWAKAQDIPIRPEDFGPVWYRADVDRWCYEPSGRDDPICLLSAVVLHCQPKLETQRKGSDIKVVFRAITGKSTLWLDDLMCGFDGVEPNGDHSDAYELGRKFRAEVKAGLWDGPQEAPYHDS